MSLSLAWPRIASHSFAKISPPPLPAEQVALIRRFAGTLESGGSLVSQMIMGAGKTTCIAPLLALLLADGAQLVMLVAVSSLLSFTRSVLRARFSSFISKPVYTFTFTRSQPATPALLARLQGAIEHRAIVCSTPAALKSFALKFVELLHTLDYGAMRLQETAEARERRARQSVFSWMEKNILRVGHHPSGQQRRGQPQRAPPFGSPPTILLLRAWSRPKAQAAPAHRSARPGQRGSSPWAQALASARPTDGGVLCL